MSWGDKLGVPHVEDEAGNILFTIPATKGKENVKPICVQGHLDMVAVGKLEDGKVPIKLEDGKLVSGVSTIGADDGIAVAAILALMEDKDKFEHGVIEGLVTMDEEIGLVGAAALAGPPFLKSRTLLNLDSEDWGYFFTSCAGSIGCWYRYEAERAAFAGRTLEVHVQGLMGGHTGLVISEGRANATKWVARLLTHAMGQGSQIRLISIEGGEKHNAVPDNATAIIVTSDDKLEEKINEYHQVIAKEFAAIEKRNPTVTIKDVKSEMLPMTEADTKKVLAFITTMRHGVWQMHPSIPGLVNTSQSLSIVKFEGTKFVCEIYARTNEGTQMDWLKEMHQAIALQSGFELEMPEKDISLPWPAALDARIVALSKEVYKRLFNEDVVIAGIHAGLECGCIQNRGYPDLEAISYGPDVHGAHSIEENVSIETATKCYELTLEILKDWAK